MKEIEKDLASKMTELDRARFWTKVEITDKCWIWKAPVDKHGYGTFGFRYEVLKAHRISYILFIGDIPGDDCILHKCDNKLCVNPRHLFTGSRADNNEDFQLKGRFRANRFLRPSVYRGVSLIKDAKKKKWRSFITYKKVRYRFGNYENEEEAARAYDKGVTKLGIKVPLNFPTHPSRI